MSDPELTVDKTLIPSPPARPKNPVFDNEDMGKVRRLMASCPVYAKSELKTVIWRFNCVFLWQLLAELLRSKNPEDLQEANRLIKNMVKEVRGSLDVIKMLI